MAEPPNPRHSALIPWGIGVGVVVAIGAWALPGLRLDPVPVTETVAPAPPQPATSGAPSSQVATGEPRFDLVRLEHDGTTLVAGRARPRSSVSVVVDGVVRATGDADAGGQFVIFVRLTASAEPRVMWLVARGQGGETLASVDTVILGPDGRGLSDLAATDLTAQLRPRPAADDSPGAGLSAPVPTSGLTTDPPVASRPTPASSGALGTDAAHAVGTAPLPGSGSAAPGGSDPATSAQRAALGVGAGPDVVPAMAPPEQPDVPLRVLLNDDDGVRVLETAPLVGQGRVRLDSVDYGADGVVVLRGRAAPGGTVAAFLDRAERGATAPDADGTWVIRLGDVDPGDYALGLVRRDSAGQVTDRIDLPFRREPAQIVAAALSGAPARVVTVQQGATLWAIARDRYGDGTRYVQVYDANRTQITDPDLIYPGQVITLPDPGRP